MTATDALRAKAKELYDQLIGGRRSKPHSIDLLYTALRAARAEGREEARVRAMKILADARDVDGEDANLCDELQMDISAAIDALPAPPVASEEPRRGG